MFDHIARPARGQRVALPQTIEKRIIAPIGRGEALVGGVRRHDRRRLLAGKAVQGLAPNIGEAADQIGLRHRGAFRLRHPIFGDDAQRLGGVGDIHREFAAGLGEVGGAHRRRHHAASLIDQLGQILGGGVEFSRERGFGRLGLATEAFTLRRARRLPDDEFPWRARRTGATEGGASTWTAGATGGGASTWAAGATGRRFSAWTAGAGGPRPGPAREAPWARAFDSCCFCLCVRLAGHFASVGEGRGFGVHLVGPLRRRFRIAIGGHVRSCSSSSNVKARPVATRAGV